MMRRALTITDEAARHPFLAGLPPHIRGLDQQGRPQRTWRITVQDVKDFLLAYCACFMAVTAFIA
jgi:predicted ArsR family transcriptional regulator